MISQENVAVRFLSTSNRSDNVIDRRLFQRVVNTQFYCPISPLLVRLVKVEGCVKVLKPIREYAVFCNSKTIFIKRIFFEVVVG